MRRKREFPPPRPSQAPAGVADAMDLLLSGCAPAWASLDPQTPRWARVNPLAHGDRARLRELAEALERANANAWTGAVGYLAGELLVGFPTDQALAEVQRQVLVPLELDLLDYDGGFDCPRELVVLLRRRLDHYTRSQDRPERAPRQAGSPRQAG